MNAPLPCSESSLAGGESLWGTANEGVTHWLLVEHANPWGAKVPKQAADLPEPVRAHLMHLNDLPYARVQLIRRPGVHEDRRHVFVAKVDPAGGRLYRARLDVDALADLDLDTMAEGKGALEPVGDPQFFVCSHGTRDACCAKHGVALYNELAALEPARTWQCSHLGGHRFAPTMLVLPHGAVYGRLSPSDAHAVVTAADGGSLSSVEQLRGRSCFTRPVQAAEVFARQPSGDLAVDALRLVEQRALSDSRWEITFDLNGRREVLVVDAQTSSQPIYGSCDDASPKPYLRYVLTDRGTGS